MGNEIGPFQTSVTPLPAIMPAAHAPLKQPKLAKDVYKVKTKVAVTDGNDGSRRTAITQEGGTIKTKVTLTEKPGGQSSGNVALTLGSVTVEAGSADPAPKATKPGKGKAKPAGTSNSVGGALELAPGTTVHGRITSTANKPTTHTLGATLPTGTSLETTTGDPKAGRTVKLGQKLGRTGVSVGVERKGKDPLKRTAKVDLKQALGAPVPATIGVSTVDNRRFAVEGTLELAPGVSVYGSHEPPDGKAAKPNLAFGLRVRQEF